jgi:formylglycine-generating enzyme required for sulfatase activity
MVVVPAGSFLMGAPPSDPGNHANERPQHRVTIANAFAAGKLDVTVDQFAAVVNDTSYDLGSTCNVWGTGLAPGKSRRDPGFPQTGAHPVTCVNCDDASAYVNWLSQKTGKVYRLLTESELEYVTRAGSTTRYYFGNDAKEFCRFGNAADMTVKRILPNWAVVL